MPPLLIGHITIKLDTSDRQATVPLIYSLPTDETKTEMTKLRALMIRRRDHPEIQQVDKKREGDGERHDECP